MDVSCADGLPVRSDLRQFGQSARGLVGVEKVDAFFTELGAPGDGVGGEKPRVLFNGWRVSGVFKV